MTAPCFHSCSDKTRASGGCSSGCRSIRSTSVSSTCASRPLAESAISVAPSLTIAAATTISSPGLKSF